MSATNFVTNIPVFEGAQGKYYIVNDKKYSVYFPIAWAHEHITFQIGEYEDKTGPEECGNCDTHGSIRGVFVGYCGNCLRNYHESNHWRGCLVAPGLPLELLEDSDMWAQYPYMSGIPKSAIGDEEGADLTDQGINLEQLDAAIAAAEAREEDNELPDEPEAEDEAYHPIFVSELDEQNEAYYGKKDEESSDEELDEEAKFDKNGRWIYPEHVLRELDRLDRKGLLYSDGARDDDDDSSYDEQSYDDGNGGSVYKNYFCEKCYQRHPKLQDYHCGDWQEGFMDC